MFPRLQPSRPKPRQQSAQPTCAHEQRHAVHEACQQTQPSGADARIVNARPRSQIEAMPPVAARQAPGAAFYDSAVRHPVFFTQNLKKPPFPIPPLASQGWTPVATGYIVERQRAMQTEPKTKL